MELLLDERNTDILQLLCVSFKSLFFDFSNICFLHFNFKPLPSTLNYVKDSYLDLLTEEIKKGKSTQVSLDLAKQLDDVVIAINYGLRDYQLKADISTGLTDSRTDRFYKEEHRPFNVTYSSDGKNAIINIDSKIKEALKLVFDVLNSINSFDIDKICFYINCFYESLNILVIKQYLIILNKYLVYDPSKEDSYKAIKEKLWSI